MKKFTLFLIRFYQKYLSLDNVWFKKLYLTDRICRFTPACSEYTYQAIEKYGLIKGGWMGFCRILHCHPWSKGGYDPVK